MTPLVLLVPLGFLAGWEAKKHYSPDYALPAKHLVQGQSYVLSVSVKGPDGAQATDEETREALEAMGLHVFSLVRDTKDPHLFAATTSYIGRAPQGRLTPRTLFPEVMHFFSSFGRRLHVTFPTDPVPYQAAAATPAGAKAAAVAPQAPAVPTTASGAWQRDVAMRDRRAHGHGRLPARGFGWNRFTP